MNILTDHEAALDNLTERTVDVTAREGVLATAALLRALGHRESADKLIKYRDAVERRIRANAVVAIHRRAA